MHKVNIADFVLYAQEKRKKDELEQMQKEIDILDYMKKRYYVEIAYLTVNMLILLCGLGILEALSR